jgi:phosphohistidine phosphatase SixA
MHIVLVRHAERDTAGADAISSKGRKRAAQLARMFADAGVTAIFTSDAERTKQTAAPLSASTGIAAREIAPDTDAARRDLLGAGDLAVVVGHSNTVPDLIAELGGPVLPELDANEFDRMFVLTLAGEQVSTLQFTYHAD